MNKSQDGNPLKGIRHFIWYTYGALMLTAVLVIKLFKRDCHHISC